MFLLHAEKAWREAASAPLRRYGLQVSKRFAFASTRRAPISRFEIATTGLKLMPLSAHKAELGRRIAVGIREAYTAPCSRKTLDFF